MFNVENEKSFRDGYLLLHWLETEELKMKRIDDCIRYIRELKRKLREYAHKPTTIDVGMGFEVTKKVFGGNYDGHYELVSIPDVFKTKGEAELFFNDFLKLDYKHSPYDCTGQCFTAWHKIFKRHNQYYVYHHICYDV